MKKYIFFLIVLIVYSTGIIFPQHHPPGLIGTHNNAFTKVEPPAIFAHSQVLGKVATSDFQIIYDGPMPPVEAQNAIEYAVNIWEFLINTAISQTIKIRVRWADLGYSSTAGYPLGNCRADTLYNSPSLPHPNVQYPIALAEYILGQNINGQQPEMTVTINSNDSVNWHYGTDGIPQSNRPDLVTTVLHEIAHGLGFSSSFRVEGNYGYFGWENFPFNTNRHPEIYDLFTVLGSYYPNADLLLNYPNGSSELKTKLTSNNVFFNGDNAWIQNGRSLLPKLYVPSGWEVGSSITHLDDNTYPAGNSNSLMTHELDNAEVIHSPGEVGLAILKDIGWSINRLATFTHPGLGVALKKGTVDTIKWTDNEGGSYSLVLLDSLDNFVMTVCTLGTAEEGYNYYVWTVPSSVANGKYRIKVQFGGAFGISGMFTITDQQQVASPVFNPEPGHYLDPVTVTCSTATSGATIRYTTNGAEPNSSSLVFPASLLVSTQTTIKAKAFKSGMLESVTTTGVYSIGAFVHPPEISPLSGTHPDGSKWKLSWTPGTTCYMNWTTDGSEPFDPSLPGHENQVFFANPVNFTFVGLYPIKVKARAKLNGSWSSLVERDYVVVPAVRIAQVDDEITGNNSFGKWKNWEGFWKEYPDTIFARPSVPTDYFLLAQQTYKEGTTRKYNVWQDNLGINYYVNHSQTPIDQNTSNVLAHFKEAKNATIKNWLEGSISVNSGYFSFRDPWLIDDSSDTKGVRNRGLNPQWKTLTYSTSPNITTGSNYMGVFPNHNPEFDPAVPIYKVWAGDRQFYLGSILGTRNFYFRGWSATGANIQPYGDGKEAWVVFNSPDAAVVQANYKGQGLSNSEEGYSNNSQRKFVRTNDGVMYNLYESLNRVWLEKSTDNGSTWSIINNGNPLKNADSRNPSMCLAYYNGLIIVFETEGLIWIYQYNPTTNNAYERTSIYSCTIAPYESNPVVTYCFNGDAPATGPVVIWKSYGNDAFCGDAGLYYALINADNWSVSPEAIITNTDINSYDPSIAGNDPIHNESIWRSDPMKFNLVWEQRSSIHSSIRFYQVERLVNNALQFTDYQIISSGNGFTKNYKPSLITVKNAQGEFKSRVVWLAERYQAEEERLEKGQGSENTEGVQYKTFFKDVGVSGFRSYGNKSNAPTINKLNNNSDYYLAFSEQSNLAGKVVIGSDPTTINQLETIGKDIQMGNGANENQAIALAFHSANLPYYFNRSANMSNVTPKIKSLAIVSGREGVVGKDTAQFYFTVGDVILDDQPIEFIELPDTALINGKEILNEYLVTNPFTLNDNSVFYYSVQYGITDSASAIQALTDSVFINFTVQLLDANTDEIIGTFDNVTYNSDSVFIYNNIAYQVNVSGLNNRLVKLRLKTETNHQFDYSLTQRYAEESVLGKKFIKQINFNAGVIITEYALEQNYPNPFNPSTTIRYQLPQDGIVTLKVYDILGSEVATLVNEQKAAGRYEITLDASRLASGVYIYKITSGGYVSSKKMLLVK